MFALAFFLFAAPAGVQDNSPLIEKARHLQQDLIDRHLIEGLYVSIVPARSWAPKLSHTVDEPGNVIHAGVWTGRYLAGVGYQYAVTKDPKVRQHGGELLRGLRRLQEVTGKPGLLARGYVKGHGPVEDWERDGRDSREWHQGQGKYADYRWYGDVSVDNFNAVLYGYAIYYDLAADESQKQIIAYDVDRLMTHLLDNQCRIIDVDGEVTLYGHVGIDPDPSRDEYYKKVYASRLALFKVAPEAPWKPALRSSLMLLPDLLIAHRITGKDRYIDLYKKVVARFKDNPDYMRDTGPYSLERLARTNHSSEGQAYEALYNLIRHEKDPELLAKYRGWVRDLWDMNWMEGNSLFSYMTATLVPKDLPHREESLRLALDTLRLYPVDRVFKPVMNSLRKDIEPNPHGKNLSAKPLPISQRPLDNEYTWKGNPYQLDGWLKPSLVAFETSCDDPQVAWFVDSAGRIFMTRDGWSTWRDVSSGLMGARVRSIRPSPARTFVLHAETDKGVFISRDGGMSWRSSDGEAPNFEARDFSQWQSLDGRRFQIRDGALVAQSGAAAMAGWRIPRATSMFVTPRGLVAGGPGGVYVSADGEKWTELKLWREDETGAADFLHAYWMGRHYGHVPEK